MGITATAAANAAKNQAKEANAKLDEINVRGDVYRTEQVSLAAGQAVSSISNFDKFISLHSLGNGNMRKPKFYNNGLKLIGHSGGYVLKSYTLSTAYDVTTAVEDYNHLDLRGRIGNIVRDFDLDDTGTYLYVLDNSSDLSIFDLQSAFVFKDAVKQSTVFDVSGTQMDNMTIKPDGTGGLLSEQSTIVMLTLPTPNSLVGASLTNATNLPETGMADQNDECVVSKDGLKVYRLDDSTASSGYARVLEHDLPTAWSTIGITQANELILNNVGPIEKCHNIAVSHNGDRLICGFYCAYFTLTLPSAYDSSSALYGGGRLLEHFYATNLQQVGASQDGTKILLGGNLDNHRLVARFTLSEPWNMETAVADQVAGLPNASATPAYVTGEGSQFNYLDYHDGGTKLVTKHSNILKISVMTTPYDLDTLVDTFTPNNIDMNSQLGFSFNSNGFWMSEAGDVVIGTRGSPNNAVFKCDLTTPFDFTNRSNVITNTSNFNFAMDCITVNSNGSALMVENSTNQSIYLFTMTSYNVGGTGSQSATYSMQYGDSQYPFNGSSQLTSLKWKGNDAYLFGVDSRIKGVYKLLADNNSINDYQGDLLCPPYEVITAGNSEHIEFTASGLKMYHMYSSGRVDQFNLTNAYDLEKMKRAYRRNVFYNNSNGSAFTGNAFTFLKSYLNASWRTHFYSSSGSTVYVCQDILGDNAQNAEPDLSGKFRYQSQQGISGFSTIYSMFNYGFDKILMCDSSNRSAIATITGSGSNINSTLFDGPITHSSISSVRANQFTPSGDAMFLMVDGETLRKFPITGTAFDLVSGAMDDQDEEEIITYNLPASAGDGTPLFKISPNGDTLLIHVYGSVYSFKLVTPFSLQPSDKIFEVLGKGTIKNVKVKRADYNGQNSAALGLEAIIDGGEKRLFFSNLFFGESGSEALKEPLDIAGYEPAFDTSFEIHSTRNTKLSLEVTYREES